MSVKEIVKDVAAGIVLSGITLWIAIMGGCQITADGITILSADYTLPEYLSCQVQDSHSVLLSFSAPVTLSDVHVGSVDDAAESFAVPASFTQTSDEDTGSTLLGFDSSMERGKEYVLFAVAEDQKGNSVHFSTVFQGYNENPAKVILSEIRTTYSNPKSEFIELYAVEGGNLSGMMLEIVYNNNTVNYLLPDIDVETGEYVVLHLRKVSDACIDETGDDLTECMHKDASPGRDIWRNDTTKILGNTGVILLWNRVHGDIVDVLLFAESSKESWPGSVMGLAAQKADASGLWQNGPGIDGAVCSDYMTVTRTLSRQGIENLGGEYPVLVWGDEWIVVGTSQGSPGAANSSVAYE